MSFWNLSDGGDASETGSEFEIEGGNLAPIPDDSSVLAMLDEAKWAQDREYNNYVSLRWSVAKPEAYANRKIFQKLWVTDDDPKAKDPAKKRDKAKRMLSAIDANAGGKIRKILESRMFTDDDLALSLCNKAMVIKVKTWSMTATDGQAMEGNWVCAVAPKTHSISVAEAVPTRKATPAKPAAGVAVEDDDIPF